MTAPVGLPQRLSGVVIHGDGRGRVLGFPTANLSLDAGELPSDGIYAALASVGGAVETLRAVVSVGANPTFAGERARGIEVHLLDQDRNLYGARLSVELLARLRPTVKFHRISDLIAQSAVDIRRCRSFFEVGMR